MFRTLWAKPAKNFNKQNHFKIQKRLKKSKSQHRRGQIKHVNCPKLACKNFLRFCFYENPIVLSDQSSHPFSPITSLKKKKQVFPR